jgi:transcriptional regulator with XRE-family HTH domain
VIVKSSTNLTALIEKRRKAKGVSLRDLSMRAGLSRSTYWVIVTKKRGFSISTALKLMKYLEMTMEVGE